METISTGELLLRIQELEEELKRKSMPKENGYTKKRKWLPPGLRSSIWNIKFK